MPRLVIAKPSGRLGNQLFQILGLVCNCDNEKQKIYLLGYDNKCLDILRLPPHVKLINPNSCLFRVYRRLTNARLEKAIARMFAIAAKEEPEDARISYVYPLLRLPFSPIVFEGIYFQKPALLNNPKSLGLLSIQPQFLSQCKERSSAYLDGHDGIHCLVHIRRTDYCFWPSKKHRAVLPMSYFVESISAAHSAHSCRTFLLCSDDLDYAFDLAYMLKDDPSLADCAFKVIDDDPTLLIGLIMTSHIKVISSSFSWVAALLGVTYCPSKHIAVYAPKYWSGHRQKRWHPSHSFWDIATYIKVKDSNSL